MISRLPCQRFSLVENGVKTLDGGPIENLTHLHLLGQGATLLPSPCTFSSPHPLIATPSPRSVFVLFLPSSFFLPSPLITHGCESKRIRSFILPTLPSTPWRLTTYKSLSNLREESSLSSNIYNMSSRYAQTPSQQQRPANSDSGYGGSVEDGDCDFSVSVLPGQSCKLRVWLCDWLFPLFFASPVASMGRIQGAAILTWMIADPERRQWASHVHQLYLYEPHLLNILIYYFEYFLTFHYSNQNRVALGRWISRTVETLKVSSRLKQAKQLWSHVTC